MHRGLRTLLVGVIIALVFSVIVFGGYYYTKFNSLKSMPIPASDSLVSTVVPTLIQQPKIEIIEESFSFDDDNNFYKWLFLNNIVVNDLTIDGNSAIIELLDDREKKQISVKAQSIVDVYPYLKDMQSASVNSLNSYISPGDLVNIGLIYIPEASTLTNEYLVNQAKDGYSEAFPHPLEQYINNYDLFGDKKISTTRIQEVLDSNPTIFDQTEFLLRSIEIRR